MSVAKGVTNDALQSQFDYKPQAVTTLPRLADFSLNRRGALIPRGVFADSVRLADFAVACGAGLIIAAMYVDRAFAPGALGYLAAVGLTGGVLIAAFDFLGLYKVSKFSSIVYQLPRIFLGWAVAFAGLAAAMFFLKVSDDFSRVWLASWLVAGVSATVLERIAVANLARHWMRVGRLYRRAVIYGGGQPATDIISALEADAEADIRICGVFDDRDNDREGADYRGYPVLGSIASLIDMARATRIDLVIIALPLGAEERISKVVTALSQLPVDIKLPAKQSQVRFAPRTYTRIGKVAMLDLVDKPMAAWGGVAKWLFDKVIASVALILLAPVLAAVAIAVKLDSRGPVLFRQKRYGFNNELIEVFKFRSMYVDMCDAAASKLVTKEDPRVTPVGRFIRKSSLDELPQLFNVLLGDLSLVGPRPHAVSAKAGQELYDEVVERYFARHKVKPGITGWAQINGWRGETDTHEKILKRVEHDLYYIENWSIFFDLYILAKTPLALLKTENSY